MRVFVLRGHLVYIRAAHLGGGRAEAMKCGSSYLENSSRYEDSQLGRPELSVFVLEIYWPIRANKFIPLAPLSNRAALRCKVSPL